MMVRRRFLIEFMAHSGALAGNIELAVKAFSNETNCTIAFVGRKYVSWVQDWTCMKGIVVKINDDYKFGWAQVAIERRS